MADPLTRAEAAAGDPVFDPFDPAWSTDPFGLYADLRERAPVHRNNLGFWVVARHADCLALLRDRRASSDGQNIDPTHLSESLQARFPAADDPLRVAMARVRPFLFRDPPDHTRLRGLVSKAFTPRMVESLRDLTSRVVDELLDGLVESGRDGPVDLLESFAYPLPVRVICELLGVPAGDQDRFRTWSGALARGLDPDFLLSPEVIEERVAALAAFAGYFFELLAERRRSPGDDLLSRLVQAEEEGSVLTEGELLSTCTLLLVAGHETTVNLISGGAVALMEHPDELRRFRDDPTVARTAVEEMLRYVSPVQLTGRFMTEDVRLGGATLERGDLAMVLLASGNRDPDAFADPDRFDVGRDPNNHLGFGFGLHHCLGAPLARMETGVALAALVRRVRTLELASDRLIYRDTVVLRGLEALPVTLTA